MSWFRTARTNRQTARFQPRLEALEDRQLLSVSSASLSPKGTWTLNGDAAADTVVITDTGVQGVDNITVSVNGQVFKPGGSIETLRLNMGGGADRVTYNLLKPLTGV